MKNKSIQSLWIGDTFSNIEKLSAASFIKNGHEYNLYCYNDIKNLPDGIKILDANDIIPESEIFCYQVGIGKGSFSAFSNFFRYKLIYEKGGYWADTDVICIKNFSPEEDYVFSKEIECVQNGIEYGEHTASCFFYSKPKADFLKACYDECLTKDKNSLQWGEVGPKLFNKKIEEFNLNKYLKSYSVFNPIPWNQIVILFDPNFDYEYIINNSYCIHLWNEVWRRNDVNKNMKFADGCLFEKLKKDYL
jgi:hypothetical protein